MKIVKININNIITTIDLDFDTNIKESLNNIDNNNLELLYEWNIESNNIECYGCLDSSANILNQHILPSYGLSNLNPNNIIEDKSNECNIYGNIYIVCKKNNNYINYYDYDYGTLYFNINDINNYCDNNYNDDDDNDDDTDNDNDNDDNDDDDNELLKSQYLQKSNNDLLDYDNNIY